MFYLWNKSIHDLFLYASFIVRLGTKHKGLSMKLQEKNLLVYFEVFNNIYLLWFKNLL